MRRNRCLAHVLANWRYARSPVAMTRSGPCFARSRANATVRPSVVCCLFCAVTFHNTHCWMLSHLAQENNPIIVILTLSKQKRRSRRIGRQLRRNSGCPRLCGAGRDSTAANQMSKQLNQPKEKEMSARNHFTPCLEMCKALAADLFSHTRCTSHTHTVLFKSELVVFVFLFQEC